MYLLGETLYLSILTCLTILQCVLVCTPDRATARDGARRCASGRQGSLSHDYKLASKREGKRSFDLIKSLDP